jgi:TonB-dependent SusC/RagA subfamily outer membrane receptor
MLMPSFLLRTALSGWVLIGLAAGCSSSSTRREPAAQPVVTGEELERSSGESIEKTLQARVPGLLVTRTPDGGIALQIRGTSTFSGSGGPLYVIDGVPIQPGPGGALTGISPHDIETIKVLKDPADIAIYGMRGADGVILVTTKRPGRRND